MSTQRIIDSLELPSHARVGQRVPKKHLLENGAPTAADKRLITDGVEELVWAAALRPDTVGVPAFRDATREYLEIAVLSLTLRPGAKARRLRELVHRAIPYPVVLASAIGEEVVLSLAHKRFSQGEAGVVILDGDVVASPDLGGVSSAALGETDALFLQALHLAAQPRVHLCAVYQGWIDCIEALQAARLTGRFVPAPTAEAAAARRTALVQRDRIQKEIATLRAQAGKETQMARRVDLNLALRRLEGELARAVSNL
jgi:hypothetical protein